MLGHGHLPCHWLDVTIIHWSAVAPPADKNKQNLTQWPDDAECIRSRRMMRQKDKRLHSMRPWLSRGSRRLGLGAKSIRPFAKASLQKPFHFQIFSAAQRASLRLFTNLIDSLFSTMSGSETRKFFPKIPKILAKIPQISPFLKFMGNFPQICFLFHFYQHIFWPNSKIEKKNHKF